MLQVLCRIIHSSSFANNSSLSCYLLFFSLRGFIPQIKSITRGRGRIQICQNTIMPHKIVWWRSLMLLMILIGLKLFKFHPKIAYLIANSTKARKDNQLLAKVLYINGGKCKLLTMPKGGLLSVSQQQVLLDTILILLVRSFH